MQGACAALRCAVCWCPPPCSRPGSLKEEECCLIVKHDVEAAVNGVSTVQMGQALQGARHSDARGSHCRSEVERAAAAGARYLNAAATPGIQTRMQPTRKTSSLNMVQCSRSL